MLPAAMRTVSALFAFVIGMIAIGAGFTLVVLEHTRGKNFVSEKKSTRQYIGLALMAFGTLVASSWVTIGLVSALIAYLVWT
jgi:hypothetical protein